MRSPLFTVLMVVVLFVAGCSPAAVSTEERLPTESSTDQEPDTQDPDTQESSVGDEAEPAENEAENGDETETNDEAEQDEDGLPQTPRQLEESEGFGLGGEEQLASLQADCENDSDMACDILFILSDLDSPEETIALSCGGRSDTATVFCTEGFDAQPDELVFDLESPALEDTISLCRTDGDLTACDFLFYRSPEDSEIEELGATCAGRVQVAVPDCRTVLSPAD